METLLSKVKIAHSRRVFCLSEDEKRKISIKDMKKGFKLYLKNDEVKSRVEKEKNPKYVFVIKLVDLSVD
jgi:hypothetical protein